MLGFFKKKQPDEDALTNLKTVSRWVQELHVGDIYSAQENVVRHLTRFNHSDMGFSKDRLQVLMYLDEETRDMQESLHLQYLRNPRMSKPIESRLWTAIQAFYWEITRSYHGFLMDYVANPGVSKLQSYVPLISARALQGFASIIKWRYFRYEKIDEKLWLRLHNLYRVTEFEHFDNAPVAVYRADSRPRTPAEIYGQTLLLSLFNNGNLVPREIDLIDQWLGNWSDSIKIDTLYDPDRHGFCVDLAKGTGLKRCRNAAGEPTLRYISSLDLLDRIRNIREALKTGTPASALGLTAGFRLPESYTLLNHVEAECSALDQRDRRQSPRTPCSGQWKVTHGLATICGTLAKEGGHGMDSDLHQLSQEEILDIQLYGFVTERTKAWRSERIRESEQQTRYELWRQSDSSDSGIGFSIGHQDSEWVKVGKLVAIAPAEGGNWNLGVVSRLARQDEGRRLVGTRLFNGAIRPVALKQENTDTTLSYIVDEPDQPTPEQPSHAILLTTEAGAEYLFIDSARYARGREYTLRMPKSKNRPIRLDAVVESGASWLMVGFKAVTT